jgi:ATP-binding cassette subfamily C (CFTR/MRP) protein 1
MVALIYSRSLNSQTGVFDDSATLTLMSTDVTVLTSSVQNFCDIWARVIEMSIGIWLLQMQLGWVCVAPLVVVAGKLPSNSFAKLY